MGRREDLTTMETGMVDALRFRSQEIKRPRISRGPVSPGEGAAFERHAKTCGGCEVCRPMRTEGYEPERAIGEARAERIATWKRVGRRATSAGSR